MSARTLAPYLILLLSAPLGACAAKAGAVAYPMDAALTDAAGPAPMEAAVALPSLSSPTPGVAAAAAPAPTPAAMFAAPTPAPAGSAPGDFEDPPAARGGEAPDPLETIGADSIDQMLIFTGQLALSVAHESAAAKIDAAVSLAVEAGGYVAQMTDTTLELRVPSRNFRRVLSKVEDLGELQSRQVQALDVSEEFHDLEVRLDNLRATRARIEKLLHQAKDLNQILVIEKELQRVTVEIDQLEGRLRLLASKAAFSTIAVGFHERPAPQQVLEIAEDTTPPTPPRTLGASAGWVHEVNVHSLLSLD